MAKTEQVLDYNLRKKIADYWKVNLMFARSNWADFSEDMLHLYTLWAKQLVRFSVAKVSDDNNELPTTPTPEWLIGQKGRDQLATWHFSQEEQDIIKLGSDEAVDILNAHWAKEIGVSRLFITLFNIHRTTEHLVPIYKHPYGSLQDDDKAHLLQYIQTTPLLVSTATQLNRIYDTISVLCEYREPEHTIAFKNAKVVDGELIRSTDPRFEEYPLSRFKVVSPLEIPERPSPEALAVFNNYAKYNPEVHDHRKKYIERPFIERELAFAVYSTLSKHTIGENKALFGGFFLYEDNDGTGGARGKSLLTEMLMRIVNSGIKPSGSLSYGGAIDAKSITIPQVQIITAPRFVNVLSERAGGQYSDDELTFIKSMREEGNMAVGKYQTQAQSTNFRGSIFTTSNYVPRFKEHSDAIRERFYGIEFTLKFAERNNSEVINYIRTPEFLASAVAWAFSDKFNFHDPMNFKEMLNHFKESYDILSKKNNAILQNFYDVLSLRDDLKHEEHWKYDEKNNVVYASQNYFKYQFALNAGSVEGASNLIPGRITPQESQYRSWMAFTDYLQGSLDVDTLQAINFSVNRRTGRTRERVIAIDLNLLPEHTAPKQAMTSVERQWMIDNGYIQAPTKEDNNDTPDTPDIPETPLMDFDEMIAESTKEVQQELNPDTLIDIDDLIKLYDYDLESDPKTEMVYENEPLTSEDMYAYVNVEKHYVDSVIGLLEMHEATMEAPSRHQKEFGEFMKELCIIAKRHTEIFHKDMLVVPLSYMMKEVGVSYHWENIPQTAFKVGVNTVQIAITDDKIMKIVFKPL